jgi:hypothetical protein
MIKWIEAENSVWQEGICCSLGIGIISHARVYLYRRGIYIHTLTENGLSSIFTQVIFDKILSIPSTSLNMIDFGMISTLLSADEITIGQYMYFCIIGSSSLVVIFPAIAIIAYYHGLYFLFAPFWIACLVLINNFFN